MECHSPAPQPSLPLTPVGLEVAGRAARSSTASRFSTFPAAFDSSGVGGGDSGRLEVEAEGERRVRSQKGS